ncbi:hypothetical protein [uncultured Clostridium sp.]|jgi:hypothetical protein|uniref:hypothetical protein n=1 Tax=uncultured Clostridium sp. TaxID=59620 RepID=UPI0026152B22|nr:hypothetical protein [uncultured Clostridium sp.]
MGLEFKVKNIDILDDLEAELSKKLKIKISFDDLNENKEEFESEKKENKYEK